MSIKLEEPDFSTAIEQVKNWTGDSIVVQKKVWGIYDLVSLSVSSRNFKNRYERKESFLIGTKKTPKTLAIEPSLIVADNPNPLVLSSGVQIMGDILCQHQKTQEGYMKNQGVRLPPVFQGKVIQQKIPYPLQGNFYQRINNLLGFTEPIPVLEQKMEHSFFETSKIYQGQNIQLNNLHLKGNIIIYGSNSISVAANSYLEDVLLIAPKIYVEPNTIGSFQAIAVSNISIGQSAELRYPSALILSPSQNDLLQVENPIGIHIASNALIEGSIYNNANIEYNNNLENTEGWITKIESLAYIHGRIWSRPILTFNGHINGNIICKGFEENRGLRKYLNYLYETKIYLNKRSDWFLDGCIKDSFYDQEYFLLKQLE